MEFNSGIIRRILHLPLFSLCSFSVSLWKACTGNCEFVSHSGVIIIQWSVCAEQFVPFSYKINSRRLSILQGAVCSSWGRFRRKRLKTLSHSEPLENSTRLLYLFYHPSFTPLSLPFLFPFSCTWLLLPLIFFSFFFIWHPRAQITATDINV